MKNVHKGKASFTDNSHFVVPMEATLHENVSSMETIIKEGVVIIDYMLDRYLLSGSAPAATKFQYGKAQRNVKCWCFAFSDYSSSRGLGVKGFHLFPGNHGAPLPSLCPLPVSQFEGPILFYEQRKEVNCTKLTE